MTYQPNGIPSPPEYRELVRALSAGVRTPEVRRAWCESIRRTLQENREAYRPVRPTRLGTPEDAMRLDDARDESARRLRTTLQAEAWMRELDVTDQLVENLALWHEQEWGITEPVSDDFSVREAVVQEAVRARVR